ncbi:MAG: class I SAM-dependent methyltransferase [Candidatus Aminicenantes bacterium]|nr:class I SAM-dependent methyltransferase [Candidatus Aminicenantes bacterium]
MAEDDLEIFIGFSNSFKGAVTLFGYNDIAKKLTAKFPGKFRDIVSFDKSAGSKHKAVRIISMEDFERDPNLNVIIVDEKRQYDYLDAIYQIMYRKNIDLLDGMQIRYKHSYYLPQEYDFEYINVRNNLPMEFAVPHDSAVRLIDCVKTTANLSGEILELGTGYGGSTYLIADTVKRNNINKTIYTIDRFKSTPYLPELSLETVRGHLKPFPNVVILQGQFEEQVKNLDISKISFCFYDAYAVPEVLRHIYPKMVPGGILLIDNYTHGCNRNWGKPMADLFFENKAEKIIRTGKEQGLVIKQ